MRHGLATAIFALAGSAAAQDLSLSAPGADDDLQQLLENTSLVLATEDLEDIKPQDVVAAARADYRALLTALYSEGYYNGVISIRVNGREAAELSPLDRIGEVRSVAINVAPGPQFTFGTTRVAPLPPDTDLPGGFAASEIARSAVIEEAARRGVSAWRDDGHAKATVADQNIVARHPQRILDATIALSPGPRLTFGPLVISGNSDVRTSAIKRIAGLPEGAVFSPEEVTDAARRLRDTGAFDSVTLTEAETIGAKNTLPILAQVAESKPRRFGFGIEYSTVDGLTVSSFWLHRNAFGGAERFRIEGEAAGIGGGTGGEDYRVSGSLTIPAIYGPHTDLTATASISREDEPDYLLDKAEIEVLASRMIFDDLEVWGGLGIFTAEETTPFLTRQYTFVTAPLRAELDRRDDPTNASSGYYIDAELTPFIELDGGSGGARIYADARYYYSFGENDRFTLAARGQIGSVVATDPTDVPVDFLFFSGGSATVRGQTYKGLGLPRVDGDEIVQVGGTSYAGAQIEARYGVTDSIGVVGFVDYGYVGGTEVPLQDGEGHSGVGLGVRYNTGIGPLRLDIGTPADGDDAFSSVQVYIGIGQAF